MQTIQPMKLKPKKCDHCGKTFMPRTYSQRFCSPVCGYDYERESRMAKRLPVRKCAFCGKEFQPVTSNHLYCSKECAYRSCNAKISVRNYALRGEKPRICEICGATYLPRSHRQKCCLSPACTAAMRKLVAKRFSDRLREASERTFPATVGGELTDRRKLEIEALERRGNPAELRVAAAKWTKAERDYARQFYLRRSRSTF